MLCRSRLTHVESAPLAATMEVSNRHGPQQGAALMKRTTKYVALDVHQATTVASVREESGRVVARSVLPTEGDALTEFFRGMRGTIHVACEEGTQAQWVHDLLVPLVDRVVVCDRRGEARSGNKADQVDADQLSEQLRRGNLRAVYHASAARATGAHAQLHEPRRGHDAGDAAAQGALPRARAPDAWPAGVSPTGAGGVAGAACGSGRPSPGRGALRRAGRAVPAPSPGEGGDGGGGATGSRVGSVGNDSLLRSRAGGAALGHDADAVAVSDQAELVGLCGARRRDPVQRGVCDRRGSAGAAPAGAADARAQSQPQPGAEGRVQGRGDGGHGEAGAAAGLVPRAAGRRDARGARAGDPDPEARGADAPALEERRALRSSAVDAASALDRTCEAAVRGVPLADGSRIRDAGARGSLERFVRPAGSHAEVLG